MDAVPDVEHPAPYWISSGITQSQICNAGDFSEMMRRQGATGDDWSDWDAHLPGSSGQRRPA